MPVFKLYWKVKKGKEKELYWKVKEEILKLDLGDNWKLHTESRAHIWWCSHSSNLSCIWTALFWASQNLQVALTFIHEDCIVPQPSPKLTKDGYLAPGLHLAKTMLHFGWTTVGKEAFWPLLLSKNLRAESSSAICQHKVKLQNTRSKGETLRAESKTVAGLRFRRLRLNYKIMGTKAEAGVQEQSQVGSGMRKGRSTRTLRLTKTDLNQNYRLA